MQTNIPYVNPSDLISRNPIPLNQPVLTKSLPSIIANVSTSIDNVIISGIYQSYVSSTANVVGTQSRAPMTMIGGIGDGNNFQRPGTVSNCSQSGLASNIFNPPVISTSRPISVRPQPSYSTVLTNTKFLPQRRNATTHMISCHESDTYPPINDPHRLIAKARSGSMSTVTVSKFHTNYVERGHSFSHNLDKTKKKSKSRLKSKYLLKVINIEENLKPGATILTFEMMLPMHQMRFTCSLSNEINTLDVSNSVGEAGQIPGELRKKDILESLVITVKKICQLLTDDLSSVCLNEDYIFYPSSLNSGLIKLSDCVCSIPAGSLDIDISQLMAPINANLTLPPNINFNSSCTSSRSLSRQPSNEDVSWSMGNLPTGMTDQISYHLTESDLILFGENNLLNPTQPTVDNQQKITKSVVCENDSNIHGIVSTKCTCPISDSTLKVPEYIFSTVKQIVDKLLNLNCKGVIILPQSNDILTRNFRVLEIPADHMFVGLPCSDSSYNVIKGQKDKDFIIARDTRDPENVTEKCVYQKPSDGAVLLDSSGEIQYIQKPSLIVPSKPGFGYEKTEIKELPSELTHNRFQSLDCDQIMSVLQSLFQSHKSSEVEKGELFDSPVLLESVKNMVPQKTQNNTVDKLEITDNQPRPPSDETANAAASAHVPLQSQIQVERIFCQYVALPKASDSRCDEGNLVLDNNNADLPKQQVRSRKISNESLDSISAMRPRTTSVVPHMNEVDIAQSQSMLQKLQKPCLMGAIVNRVTNVPCSVSGPFVNQFPNQTPSNSMSGNIFLQNVQNLPLYSNPNQGSGAPITMPQNSAVIPNKNFPHNILPNQMILPNVMNQMSQLHQMQQNTGQQQQRITAVPSSTVNLGSNQLLSMQAALQHNMIPPITQISSFTDQYGMQSFHHASDISGEQSFTARQQIPLTNVRQMAPLNSSQFFDSNVLNSLVADNLRIQQQIKNQPIQNAQPQTGPLLLISHPTQSCGGGGGGASSSTVDCQPQPQMVVEGDGNINKPKAEQTIGRFVIRPVTDNSENS